MGRRTRTPGERGLRRNLLAGSTLVLAMVACAGGWAATTPLAGAVIASGLLVVDSHVKEVQHPTGGIVGTLNVRDGSAVAAGDVLLSLDETQTRANMAIVEKRLVELQARRARLIAERDGRMGVSFEGAFPEGASAVEVAEAKDGETSLFIARRAMRFGMKRQLDERIAQTDEEIVGLQAQIVGKDREIALIEEELGGVRHLLGQGLVQVTRVNALDREAARLASERGTLLAGIAQARGRTAETRLQILSVDEELQGEVASELREIEGAIGEFTERRVAAFDQLKRVDIRAPQSGIVHEIAVHTADAVIAAGETVMLIVPAGDSLRAELHVSPQDIDQIAVGQTVQLRFSAFRQGTTPVLNGAVEGIGADLTRDAATGRSHYRVRVAIPDEEVARLGDLRLLPGMPVEAFARTGERTALSYLVKPLQDQIERSFRAD